MDFLFRVEFVYCVFRSVFFLDFVKQTWTLVCHVGPGCEKRKK